MQFFHLSLLISDGHPLKVFSGSIGNRYTFWPIHLMIFRSNGQSRFRKDVTVRGSAIMMLQLGPYCGSVWCALYSTRVLAAVPVLCTPIVLESKRESRENFLRRLCWVLGSDFLTFNDFFGLEIRIHV